MYLDTLGNYISGCIYPFTVCFVGGSVVLSRSELSRLICLLSSRNIERDIYLSTEICWTFEFGAMQKWANLVESWCRSWNMPQKQILTCTNWLRYKRDRDLQHLPENETLANLSIFANICQYFPNLGNISEVTNNWVARVPRRLARRQSSRFAPQSNRSTTSP